MLLDVLDRPGDGCAALRALLTDNDETRPAQRRHIRRAIAIYRSLLAAGVVERLEPARLRRPAVRVTVDLQADFALNQPLSPFVLEALPRLDPASPVHALDVVSVVESTLENPGPVLAAQLSRLRTETLAQLKADGVEYESQDRGPRPARVPQAAPGVDLRPVQRLPAGPPLGRRPQHRAQVGGPGPVRTGHGLR